MQAAGSGDPHRASVSAPLSGYNLLSIISSIFGFQKNLESAMEKLLDDHSNRWKNRLVILIISSIVGWLINDYQSQISSHRSIFLVVSAIMLLTGGLLIWKTDRVNA